VRDLQGISMEYVNTTTTTLSRIEITLVSGTTARHEKNAARIDLLAAGVWIYSGSGFFL